MPGVLDFNAVQGTGLLRPQHALCPFPRKKGLQHRRAFLLKNTAHGGNRVQKRVIQQVKHAAAAARARLKRAKYQTAKARIHKRTRTHGTRLKRNIQRAIRHTPGALCGSRRVADPYRFA